MGPPGRRDPELAATLADPLRKATAFAVAWLKGLPRRAGNRLFAINDAEARWHGWQVRELSGGLGRQYRDPRFGTPRYRIDPHGGRVESGPGHGTRQAPWLGGFIPGVPEAWDDHWDGRVHPQDQPDESRRRGKGREL